MLPECRGSGSLLPRLAPWLLLVSALAVRCGVPLSAEEITATVQSGGVIGVTTTIEDAPGARGGPFALEQARSALLGTPFALPADITTPTPVPTVTPTVAATPVAVTVTPPPATSGGPAVSPAVLAAEALRAVNQARTSSGRAALRQNQTLTAAAERYARYLAENNFFAHNGLDGSTPQSRVTASGYAGSFRGEALAAGQTSGQTAVNTWLNSPAHAAIVLDQTAVEIGIGYFYRAGSSYGHYWVLIVGAP
jgi:uncharacterized protein YkwD